MNAQRPGSNPGASANLGDWCNGNTPVFGTGILGSSPRSPAISKKNTMSIDTFVKSCVAEREAPSVTFTVYPEEQAKIAAWLKDTVYPAIIAKQKAAFEASLNAVDLVTAQACWDAGQPWEGCSGGGLTYMFIPTTIGQVTKVKYHGFDEVFDATDYDCW